jgi:Skp family chaperone for outer membrane proteins
MAAIVLSIGYANFSAMAQTLPPRTPVTRAAARPVTPVVLLDVSYIMKNHKRRKAMMEQMKVDMQRATAEAKSQSDTIRKLVERLKGIKPGTPEYKTGEAEALRLKSELDIKMQLQKREFMQREAKILYNVYQEIKQEVNYYATAKNVSMVVQFNGDKVDKDNPQDIIRGINQSVVWYSKNLDITPIILNRLNPPDGVRSNPSPITDRRTVPFGGTR